MLRFKYILIVVFLLGLAGGVIHAQPTTVTDDEVNAIAEKIYCPVCENITLDTCPTAACADWRYEIRLQLEEGKTEKQIVDDFVNRFGDRVVGTPQDPVLRALSLITPWLMIAVALVGAGIFLARQQRPVDDAPEQGDDSQYHDLLEQDIAS